MMKPAAKIQKAFFDQLGFPSDLRRLFEHLPDVHFFVKNEHSEIMAANDHFAQRLGFENEQALIGLTTEQVSPPELVEGYLADDQRVMNTGQELTDIIELNQAADGSVNWFLTCKIPLYKKDGSIAGIAGMARDIKKAQVTLKPYDQFGIVFDYITEHYAETISIPDLADMVTMSLSRFERQFKKTFSVTPRQYIIRYRINRACQLLMHTNKPISDIALETGFYDQSSMTKHFTKHMNMTPRAYRHTFMKNKSEQE